MSPSQTLKKAHRACGYKGESLRSFAQRIARKASLGDDESIAAKLWLANKAKQRARSAERRANNSDAHGKSELRSCAPTNHAVSMRGNPGPRKAS